MNALPNMREAELSAHWPAIEQYQSLAAQYGIRDIFQDAGGKLLQLAIVTGLDLGTERLGPDATDRMGNEYEIKSTDISLKTTGFSTSHHLTGSTLRAFRDRRWVFAIYKGIRLIECYLLEADQLEPVFQTFERNLQRSNKDSLNNPKIPIDYVRTNGRPFQINIATA